jgi:hypothetical protein
MTSPEAVVGETDALVTVVGVDVPDDIPGSALRLFNAAGN